ncbi:MAG: peptidylprolyl isomerase, partial [Proteobacteria bacterium]|nr:peptidylprolyl isomerase [Pseudomonadota bacterium]
MKLVFLVTTLMLLASCGGETPKEQSPSDEAMDDNVELTPADKMLETIDSITGINIDKSNPDWKSNLQPPALMSFEPGQEILWKIETNVGDMTFRLFPDIAPMHVTSTIYLTELGFYDDIVFHRVITGFMAQGGDPLGVGSGGPGYEYDGEFSPEVRHDRPGL